MYDEALIPKASAAFPKLSHFKGFYLVGGTALALHIGHRVSVNFDLFSSKELPQHLLQQIKKVFCGSTIVITYRIPEQLNLAIDGIKYTFFFFEYPLINTPVMYKKVPVATITELAAMKAFSIGKHLSYKDYVDWYFLLKDSHVELPKVISAAKKKFGADFNDRLFFSQLASLEDVPAQKIDFLHGDVDRETIQKFLKATVLAYLKACT